jgi:hypothetical protein
MKDQNNKRIVVIAVLAVLGLGHIANASSSGEELFIPLEKLPAGDRIAIQQFVDNSEIQIDYEVMRLGINRAGEIVVIPKAQGRGKEVGQPSCVGGTSREVEAGQPCSIGAATLENLEKEVGQPSCVGAAR